MSLLDLPTEVRFLVVEKLCLSSLRNMALVWGIPEIRRLLFYDIRIHSMKLNVQNCLQNIQNKPPEIRSLVHTFYLRSFPETMSDFCSLIAPRTLAENFPNLQALEFDHVSVDSLEHADFAGMLGIHENVSALMLRRGDYTLAKFLAILVCFPNLRVIELVWFYVSYPALFVGDVDYPVEPAIVDFDACDLPKAPKTLSLEVVYR